MENERFEEFGNELSREFINELKSMENTAEKDSSFVLLLMRQVYHDDLHRLKNKTFSGRKKEPLTPEKVKLIESVFKKRLHGQQQADARIKNVSKYVKTAIESINKKN